MAKVDPFKQRERRDRKIGRRDEEWMKVEH
jgi:hypothetical protein